MSSLTLGRFVASLKMLRLDLGVNSSRPLGSRPLALSKLSPAHILCVTRSYLSRPSLNFSGSPQKFAKMLLNWPNFVYFAAILFLCISKCKLTKLYISNCYSSFTVHVHKKRIRMAFFISYNTSSWDMLIIGSYGKRLYNISSCT